MIPAPLESREWVRLTSYYATTSSGLALTPDQAADCDALAARIKIPRPKTPIPPGTMPPSTPITSQPPDSQVIV